VLYFLGFLALLGPLVIVHEFGHYLFARIFGVKAEVFSIGFGPKIWSRQLGETELRLAVVPLGGYVELLGEDPESELPPELASRSLQKQVPWKRFFIFFGGPLFNFLFAILIFMAILVIGEPQMTNLIGRVVHDSPAEIAGFRSGDRVMEIDGKPIKKYDDVVAAISAHPGTPMHFEVTRRTERGPGTPVAITITPSKHEGFSVYGEATNVGEIQGLIPVSRSNEIGISDPSSPAARAGIRSDGKVASFNGDEVKNWEQLEKLYEKAPSGPVTLKIQAAEGEATREVRLTKPQKATTLAQDWGLRSSELFVEKTIEKSPAEASGVKAGDRLIGVGNLVVRSFTDLRDAVQHAGEQSGNVHLVWERDGKIESADIKPNATVTKDPTLKKVTEYTVGVVPKLTWAEPETFLERTWNPAKLLYRGTQRMVVFTWRNVVSIGKMIKGDVSIGTLGGPILIGKIAGESLARGLISFLNIMAVLSVGLGVLNVLPIPVLDGGHLLLLVIEGIRGRPLSLRQMEIVQQVGLSLILLLMVVVMKNDISRLPFFN
jgi:regulator of sigma E protease